MFTVKVFKDPVNYDAYQCSEYSVRQMGSTEGGDTYDIIMECGAYKKSVVVPDGGYAAIENANGKTTDVLRTGQ